MRLRAIDDWQKYLELLRDDATEAEALAGDVSSNVTGFFRDDKAFARLEGDVLPRLFALRSGDRDTVRVWIVGCCCGRGHLLARERVARGAARHDIETRVQIFASDVAEEALQRARLGIYAPEIEDWISGERLAKFFVRDEHGYRVRPELRNIVVFAFHDVVNDFPFSQLDLVVCRPDVLEDLKPEVRKTCCAICIIRCGRTGCSSSTRARGSMSRRRSCSRSTVTEEFTGAWPHGRRSFRRRGSARASRRATRAHACAAEPRSTRGSCTSACSSGMHLRACSSTPTVTSFTTRRGPAVTFAYPVES